MKFEHRDPERSIRYRTHLNIVRGRIVNADLGEDVVDLNPF